VWFSFNASGQIVGSLLAYGLFRGQQAGTLALPGWQLVFIILGLFTTSAGVVFAVVVPDTPAQARFLEQPREADLIFKRIMGNQQGVINKQLKGYQIVQAVRDPMVSKGATASDVTRHGCIALWPC